MARKAKAKSYLIVLVNVGGTHESEDPNETSFLEKSKLAMKHLIQRQIFLRPNDEVGVIIMGASETNNRLSYDNIVEMNSMELPTWDLLEKIAGLRGTNETANWVDGLSVVLDYVRAECVDDAKRTVVLFTDFQEDCDVIEQYDMDTIIADIESALVTILSIGTKSLTGDTKVKMKPSEKLFANVCKKVQGESLTFDDTLPKLMIYKNIPTNSTPWGGDLDLYDINIPIIMYMKTADDFKIPKWRLLTSTGTADVPVQRNRALVDSNRKEVSNDDIITGYMYGRKFVPFSGADESASEYDGGPRGMIVYGFTKDKNITLDCLSGESSYIVVPGPHHASPFYSLVKVMVDQKKVALVRRVSRARLAPKMGVLIPKINVPGNPWCLVYIELVFAEARRIVQSKPIRGTMNELKEDQMKAIDNLIESMMLGDAEDESTNGETGVFEIGSTPDINRQCVWDRLAHRALNPGSPSPPLSDFLQTFLEPSKSVQMKAKPILKEIKELFPINIVQKKKSARNKNEPVGDGELDPDGSFKFSEEITDPPAASKLESDKQDNIERVEIGDDELAQVTDAAEAAEQEMEIDLEELAKKLSTP